jgi:Nucleotidyl transferase AbiEii toxin, Type IV TA system
MANSRMKDFHDLRSLAGLFGFDGAILARAMAETFARRKTDLPIELPTAFTAGFYENQSKRKQWTAFTERNRLYIERRELSEVVVTVAGFLMPVIETLANKQSFTALWSPGGPWANANEGAELSAAESAQATNPRNAR